MSLILDGTNGISGVDGSASTPALQGNDSNTGVFFGTDTVTLATGGTAAVTVDSGQRTKFPTTIAIGNATPSTSGSGITFPATQSASTDANTLDDYEQGTWTPTIVGTSAAGVGTYSDQIGRYTKIGNMVTVSGYISWSAHTGTGNMRIGGFPFSSLNVTNAYYNFTLDYAGLTVPASSIAYGQVRFNSTEANVNSIATAGTSGAALAMDTSATIDFSVTYLTAD